MKFGTGIFQDPSFHNSDVSKFVAFRGTLFYTRLVVLISQALTIDPLSADYPCGHKSSHHISHPPQLFQLPSPVTIFMIALKTVIPITTNPNTTHTHDTYVFQLRVDNLI